ncbi:DUF3570 domain-containing protein [Candidatus Magnetomonas plexicatena]|uniref:DUF3570 domain-containing protein n=1 Tax=Candidatus Magnetomonas plexicatena TaxID=2552947 RepID=UPI001C7754ED|nr:DUF3570 domain-containing protein [Nitrospirales bacterium LBB_01]
MRLLKLSKIVAVIIFVLFSFAALNAEELKDKISLGYDFYTDSGDTKVYSPNIGIYKKITGNFLIGGKLRVDAITSATMSNGGRKNTVDAVTSATRSHGTFDEMRYAPNIFAEYKDDENALTLGGYYSTENDYIGRSLYADYTRLLNEQNTALGLAVSYAFDKWRPSFSRVLSTYDRNETDIDASVTQLFSPTFSGQLVYSFIEKDGYLASPYYYLTTKTFSVFERYPERRTGHALAFKLIKALDPLTSLHFKYRLYTDTWDINAHTFEVELYREIAKPVTFGVRYRFYTQGAADFMKPISQYKRNDQYIGVDYRYSAFNSNTFGLALIFKPKTTETAFIDLNKMKIKCSADYYVTSKNDYIRYWYDMDRMKALLTSLTIDYEF